MTTIVLEELTPETRQAIEGWISSEAPIMFLREGQIYAELTSYASSTSDLTSEEEELTEVFREAEANYAAGNYITLDEFKVKYADKLSGKLK